MTTHTIVIGSGAAGLAAAIGAAANGSRVTVIERTGLLGGTTAISGGVAWIADAAAPEGKDPREAALTYLHRLVPTGVDDELIETYVANVSRVITQELDKHAGLQLVAYPTPDYHPELPGGVAGGRSFGPADFWPSADALGPLLDLIRDAPFRMQWINEEIVDAGWWQAGRALVGTLVASARRLGVEFVLDTRARRLLMTDGRVTGIAADGPDGSVEFRGDAVILAAGGYEHNERLCEQHFGFAFEGPMSPPWNEGDALTMASGVGADLANLNGAWWFPVYHVDGERQDHAQAVRDTNRVRALPGTIVVNSAGERFVDEGRSYNIVGRAMAHFDPATASYPNLPAWLVFGDDMVRQHGVTAFGDLTPDPRWATTADSFDELAQKVGIDPEGLRRTVEVLERDVAAGHDSQFGRGDSVYDQFQGDRERLGERAASFGTLGEPPYHAVRLLLGTLGTKGGPRTDGSARVLDTRQQPIVGLYAAGNAASSVMRASYPGGGSTIGPALTFGFIAGEHASKLDSGVS